MSAIRVLHGTPDDCELAALVAVLEVVRTTRPARAQGPTVWGDPGRLAREPRAGAGAWRLSGLPH